MPLWGLAGGAFWLTREEALWLGPALLPLFGSWMYRTRREWRGWIVLAVPIVAFLVPVSAVNIANYVVYGVYRNSDLRSAEVQAAYGAISRIQPDAWQPYVVFPRAARGRAYTVSPAAAELRRYFEGEKAEQWVLYIACRAQTASTDCPEILAGWFIWALRDAMAEAGHYRSATDARDYHERLAAEINAACDDGRLACLPARVTLMPPFRAEFVRGTFDAAVRAAWGAAARRRRCCRRAAEHGASGKPGAVPGHVAGRDDTDRADLDLHRNRGRTFGFRL